MTDHTYINEGRGNAICSCQKWAVRLSDLSTDDDRAGNYAYRKWEIHKKEFEDLEEGLAQSARGETVSLGTFAGLSYEDALKAAKKACGRAEYELGNEDGTYRVEYPEVNDALMALHKLLEAIEAQEAADEALRERLERIIGEIDLEMNCTVRLGYSARKGWFVQIQCYRKDVITGEMGYGRGGKAFPSPHATDSEIIQLIFGLYASYWAHEAREGFQWRDRRVFGPHIKTEALHSVAKRVELRAAQHTVDNEDD